MCDYVMNLREGDDKESAATAGLDDDSQELGVDTTKG
jgi:hypothetical protein